MFTDQPKPSIEPIQKVGDSRQGTLTAYFSDIVNVLGKPNVTDLEDGFKVTASWGFRDAVDGRQAFVWCYNYDRPEDCNHWSCSGSFQLLQELFGEAVSRK